jgi:hypothetical protein
VKYRHTRLVLWIALIICMPPIYFIPEWALRIYASLWVGMGISNEWVRRRAAERMTARLDKIRLAETRMYVDGLIKRDVQ